MLSNRLAFAALGVACVAAAAGGGYLATRQNAVPVPASAAATFSPASAPAPGAAPAAGAPAPKQEAQASGAAGNRGSVPPATATPDATTASRARRDSRPSARAPEPRPSRAPLPSQQVARQDAPPLDRPAPTAAAQMPIPPPALPAAPATPGDVTAPAADDVNQDPGAPPEPQKVFEELVVPADSVIGLQTDISISSERARVEDRVNGRVTRDVRVNNRVAIPAGAKAIGTVTLVERGGKFKERARLGVRFHTLVLADGSTIPIQTETIYRDGGEIARGSATKIGAGAAAGALIGAIFGGGKGAAIGGAAGAGAGTAAAAAGPRSQATLIAGSTVTVRLSSPATVTIEK